MFQVDLNCDLGESFGVYSLGMDEAILPFVSSANIACGFHAGDPSVMRKTVELCCAKGVALGAHPGFPDLIGFGRRELAASAQEVQDMVMYQIGALSAFVQAAGGVMQHVKPHGALYNMAAKNKGLAEAIARAVYQVNPQLILVGLSGSELIKAGGAAGLKTASEVFADRTYQQDGSLTPRSQVNAMVEDEAVAISRVIRMVKEGVVETTQGETISLQADTVCIHGDSPKALVFAQNISKALAQAGISVRNRS